MDENELTITVGDTTVSGWETVSVTLRAEGFPNSFDISMSSPGAASPSNSFAKAGDTCIVRLGGDTVITGFVDRDINSGDANSHIISLSGRGKTCDLVDCSAEWDGGQILSANALEIATKLVKPYGIKVRMADGADPGPSAPQFNLTYGETPADIIQRLARNAGLLAYEDPNGILVLARTGTIKAASGIAYGVNVQSWSATNSMDQRYDTYRCVSSPINVLGDIKGNDDSFFYDTTPDPNVPRHRLLYFPPEAAIDFKVFTPIKVKWEAARRAGRATAVQATVDSWRDSAGKLWTPNTLIDVNVPGLRTGDSLCIAEVTFTRTNEAGTLASIYAMPPQAFAPEPISLQTVNIAEIKEGGAVQ